MAKATAPLPPVAGDRRRHRPFGPIVDDHRRLHPDRVHLVRDQGQSQLGGDHVLGQRDLHGGETEPPTRPARSQILVDGQSTGKVNFAPSTAATPAPPVPIVSTVMQTTVLSKGGHTVAVQYAGAKA